MWRRIDHCQFENYMGNPVRVSKLNEVSTNRPARTKCWAAKQAKGLQVCLNACTQKAALDKSRDWSCTGVNVVPMVNPLTTAPMFHDFSMCDDISTEIPEGTQERCDNEWAIRKLWLKNNNKKPDTQPQGCMRKAKQAAEAEFLACRKSIVNIPWASSILARPSQLKKPTDSGICVETDAFKAYAVEEVNNGVPPLVCYGVRVDLVVNLALFIHYLIRGGSSCVSKLVACPHFALTFSIFFPPFFFPIILVLVFLSQVQTYLGPRQHEQNVGELWRVSDDPSDPVFYSSCMIHGPLERTFKGTTCGDACKLSASSVSSTEWKFGEQCIGCNLAKRQYKTTQTPKWVLGNDENRPCHQCEQWEAPHDEEKCQNTIGWDNGAKKDCYQYQNNGWCTCTLPKCNDGKISAGKEWTTGVQFNFPEHNCCVCGGSSAKALAHRL